ncbi:MAG: molybdopterin-dependent oxidoreductase [Dehalococcoidales bacterium]|nr:molybdopterin-dependent oxidoreductase [Dehalococcoidales bacterium]
MAGKIEVKRTFCGLCEWAGLCAIRVYVQGGHVLKVEGDPDSPFRPYPKKGVLCPKGSSAVEWLYHPERLNYPLKRVGERGENKWQRITWAQAWDEIVNKLQDIKERYGAEALATLGGTGRSNGDYLRLRFQNLFGSPNWARQGIICWGVTFLFDSITYGWQAMGGTTPGVTRCILAWGLNPAHSSLPTMRHFHQCKEAGAKIIVVDPRHTEMVDIADMWLQLRPGTDTALALGMARVIIEEGLYDKDFVDKWCYGFDKLQERVTDYPLDKVSEITWIPAEKIGEAARVYAANKPAVIPWGVSIDQLGRNTAQAIRARAILRSITGNVDLKGGDAVAGPRGALIEPCELELNEKMSPEQLKKQLGSDRFRAGTWPGWELIDKAQRKVLKPEKYNYIPRNDCTGISMPLIWPAILKNEPYPIKAIICQGSNPLIDVPNSKMVHEALRSQNLDLFIVHDNVMTPSAMLADYVLPAADYLERPTDVARLTGRLSMQIGGAVVVGGERAIQPLYERKTDFDFWRELSVRLGYKEYWPWETEEELYDYCLKPVGIGFQELCERKDNWLIYPPSRNKKYETPDPRTGKPTGFATPTGKVELYSTILEQLGYDPLPHYDEPPESPISTPELAKEYPLILITGARFRYMFHSEYRQLKSVRKITPNPRVEIHPETAARLNISDGDWVYIETPRGRVKQQAKVIPNILPGVVSAQHHWWFPEQPADEPSLFGAFESNINVCTNSDPATFSPECGAYPLRPLLCKVYPVSESA